MCDGDTLQDTDAKNAKLKSVVDAANRKAAGRGGGAAAAPCPPPSLPAALAQPPTSNSIYPLPPRSGRRRCSVPPPSLRAPYGPQPAT